jgi:CheY-like chemotaxis protein
MAWSRIGWLAAELLAVPNGSRTRVTARVIGDFMPKDPACRVRVLVVDDDAEDLAFLVTLLQRVASLSVQLVTSHDPERALQELAGGGIDLCIVDQLMPRMTGLQFVRSARARGCSQPIILVTGAEGEDLDVALIAAGGTDYLVKDDLDTGRLETAIRLSLARTARWRGPGPQRSG